MQAGRGKASRQPTQGLTSSFDALGWQESVTRQMELPHPPPSYPLSSRTGSGNGMAEHMAPQSDPQPISLMRAARRTGMALQRTRVSVDRTSSSLISFGFTSYQVCAEPRQAPVSGRRLTPSDPLSGSSAPQRRAARLQPPKQAAIGSVPAEHEGLEGKYQGLQPENQGVHECKGIHDVQRHAFQGTGLLCRNLVVIVGVGVGDAAAARRYPFKSALIKGLERN